MMMFYFDGEFIETEVFSFLKDFSSRARGETVIYFSSEGGSLQLTYVFADSLWRISKNDIKLKIIFYDAVHSASFFFLHYLLKVKEELKSSGLRNSGDEITWAFLDTAYGILHSITHSVDKEESKETYEIETKLTHQMNTLFIDHYSKKLTKAEKELFKKGKDVLFEADRLQKLFGGEIIKSL